jgi:hypothetical protein
VSTALQQVLEVVGVEKLHGQEQLRSDYRSCMESDSATVAETA